MHTTCLPSPGTNSEQIPGKFHFLCQNYTEELTFSLVPGGVRNRAGANEQFCGAVKYETAIRDLKGTLLHEENGMYLWLDQIYNHAADDESVETDIGQPELAAWDFPHLAISRSMGGADTDKDGPIDLGPPPPKWVFDEDIVAKHPSSNKAYTQRILAHELYPYSSGPT